MYHLSLASMVEDLSNCEKKYLIVEFAYLVSDIDYINYVLNTVMTVHFE